MKKILFWIFTFILTVTVLSVALIRFTNHLSQFQNSSAVDSTEKKIKTSFWVAPDTTLIPNSSTGEMIRYGRDLIARTAFYLGPKGIVLQISNGMNCQNCHLDAGTKPWGNNFSAVYSCYPKFRERSGSVEGIVKRVNDCFERSLNGKSLDSTSREMQSILAYIQWLGTGVKKGAKPNGVGIADLTFPDRAANPINGKIIFADKCARCHGTNGSGQMNEDASNYTYPPLWGEKSYNTGAGLYRLGRFAGFVKNNMPFGVTHDSTVLTDEEAWDVAAFVNSQPRPQKDLSHDYPKISSKPFDYPFGPYSDGFNEAQHKFGPFAPIKKAISNSAKK